MKKMMIKLAVLSILIGSIVSCRDDYHYHITQEFETDVIKTDMILSQDRKVLIEWLNKEIEELDMKNHPILKNIKKIGADAFGFQRNLNKITLPSELEIIESGAFNQMSLISIEFPHTINEIERWAFFGNKLTEINLPPKLKSIKEKTFAGNRLTSVNIPEGVESIGDFAFENNQISSIVLPSTIKEIGWNSFWQNPIETVVINAIIPPTTSAFGEPFRITSVNENFRIKVPSQSVEAYKTSKYWQEYARYIVAQ